VLVFDLETLNRRAPLTMPARGVSRWIQVQHGFCSSSPVVMWDSKTLATIKTIEVQGRPDGIIFEPWRNASTSSATASPMPPSLTPRMAPCRHY